MEVIAAIHPKQLNSQPDGTVTVTLIGDEGLTNNDTHNAAGHREQLPGDVLSVQPDGSLECRRAGTASAFEKARLDGGRLVFMPLGAKGHARLLPYATVTVNV